MQLAEMHDNHFGAPVASWEDHLREAPQTSSNFQQAAKLLSTPARLSMDLVLYIANIRTRFLQQMADITNQGEVAKVADNALHQRAAEWLQSASSSSPTTFSVS